MLFVQSLFQNKKLWFSLHELVMLEEFSDLNSFKYIKEITVNPGEDKLTLEALQRKTVRFEMYSIVYGIAIANPGVSIDHVEKEITDSVGSNMTSLHGSNCYNIEICNVRVMKNKSLRENGMVAFSAIVPALDKTLAVKVGRKNNQSHPIFNKYYCYSGFVRDKQDNDLLGALKDRTSLCVFLNCDGDFLSTSFIETKTCDVHGQWVTTESSGSWNNSEWRNNLNQAVDYLTNSKGTKLLGLKSLKS